MTGETTVIIQTGNLKLLPRTRVDVLADLEALPSPARAQMSPAWLALLEASVPCDPWIHGFTLVLSADDGSGRSDSDSGAPVGQCGFKGPPDADGMVEIAYMVESDHQGRGYATQAARALTDYALGHPSVRTVRAHTLPERNASTRILTKCGFQNTGEVMDPDDGPVWRWEKVREADC